MGMEGSFLGKYFEMEEEDFVENIPLEETCLEDYPSPTFIHWSVNRKGGKYGVLVGNGNARTVSAEAVKLLRNDIRFVPKGLNIDMNTIIDEALEKCKQTKKRKKKGSRWR
eukprot:gb/GEZN01028499.1/.p1 GENE.gb/GEZN01028499.1/~~gb/GEZN01028499.1/.p1  ORF type:complete len:111 (-),score=10.85 gb/GEZN01028499.1/:123-455(-)